MLDLKEAAIAFVEERFVGFRRMAAGVTPTPGSTSWIKPDSATTTQWVYIILFSLLYFNNGPRPAKIKSVEPSGIRLSAPRPAPQPRRRVKRAPRVRKPHRSLSRLLDDAPQYPLDRALRKEHMAKRHRREEHKHQPQYLPEEHKRYHPGAIPDRPRGKGSSAPAAKSDSSENMNSKELAPPDVPGERHPTDNDSESKEEQLRFSDALVQELQDQMRKLVASHAAEIKTLNEMASQKERECILAEQKCAEAERKMCFQGERHDAELSLRAEREISLQQEISGLMAKLRDLEQRPTKKVLETPGFTIEELEIRLSEIEEAHEEEVDRIRAVFQERFKLYERQHADLQHSLKVEQDISRELKIRSKKREAYIAELREQNERLRLLVEEGPDEMELSSPFGKIAPFGNRVLKWEGTQCSETKEPDSQRNTMPTPAEYRRAVKSREMKAPSPLNIMESAAADDVRPEHKRCKHDIQRERQNEEDMENRIYERLAHRMQPRLKRQGTSQNLRFDDARGKKKLLGKLFSCAPRVADLKRNINESYTMEHPMDRDQLSRSPELGSGIRR